MLINGVDHVITKIEEIRWPQNVWEEREKGNYKFTDREKLYDLPMMIGHKLELRNGEGKLEDLAYKVRWLKVGDPKNPVDEIPFAYLGSTEMLDIWFTTLSHAYAYATTMKGDDVVQFVYSVDTNINPYGNFYFTDVNTELPKAYTDVLHRAYWLDNGSENYNNRKKAIHSFFEWDNYSFYKENPKARVFVLTFDDGTKTVRMFATHKYTGNELYDPHGDNMFKSFDPRYPGFLNNRMYHLADITKPIIGYECEDNEGTPGYGADGFKRNDIIMLQIDVHSEYVERSEDSSHGWRNHNIDHIHTDKRDWVTSFSFKTPNEVVTAIDAFRSIFDLKHYEVALSRVDHLCISGTEHEADCFSLEKAYTQSGSYLLEHLSDTDHVLYRLMDTDKYAVTKKEATRR